MKILVFSDSHQYNRLLKSAIEMHLNAGTVDCIFYLGDGVKDINGLYPQIPICYVDGNYEEYVTGFIDRKKLKSEVIVDFMGFRFFLTHGHRYSVKSTFDNLINAARGKNADIVLFGHTHEQYYKYLPPESDSDKPMYIFNPGSISRPRDNKFSYGIIEIQKENILITHATV